MHIAEETDVLVIGAGPSGTIAASIIKDHGYDVVVVEKMKFPRFVIGESLLPRCMEALEEAGFLDAVKAKNFQQKNGAKFVRNEEICDFNFTAQYSDGYNWTWQVPRAEFDHTLAEACVAKGIPVHYETEVTHIAIENGSSVITLKDKEGKEHTVKAKFIVDGSGYGRVIPKMFGLEKQSGQNPRKALFVHLTDPHRKQFTEPDRIIAVIHNKSTWVWVIPFSNGNTSLGFVGSPEFFDQYPGTPEEQLKAMIADEPQLAARFADSTFIWEPRILQSWSATTEKFYGEGYVLTGNVTEFLDPIFSSGVTLASVSAQKAAHLVIKTLKGETVNWEEDYQIPMQNGVDVFRSFVNAWYDGSLHNIFFMKNPEEKIKSQVCSVLAGYVWDESNPFVTKHQKNIKALSNFALMQVEQPKAG